MQDGTCTRLRALTFRQPEEKTSTLKTKRCGDKPEQVWTVNVSRRSRGGLSRNDSAPLYCRVIITQNYTAPLVCYPPPPPPPPPHWSRARSCIPGLRFLLLLFYSCPVSSEVTFNGAVGIKNTTLAGTLLLFFWPG